MLNGNRLVGMQGGSWLPEIQAESKEVWCKSVMVGRLLVCDFEVDSGTQI